jgi:hypothetical protein
MRGTHIFKNTDMPIRTQNHLLRKHLKKQDHYRPTVHYTRLKECAWENVEFPWDLDADNTVEEINTMRFGKQFALLHKRYGFFVNHTNEKVDLISRAEHLTLREDFGLILVHYAYLAGVHSSQNSRLATPEAALRFAKTEAALIKILKPYNFAWAELIRARLMVNNISDIWNNTPRSNRNTTKMQALVKKSGYVETLVKYNEIVTNEYRAPFSALAVSSRFCWRQYYDDLYNRLKRAAPEYGSLTNINNKKFYDDFDDFREWVQQTFPDAQAA